MTTNAGAADLAKPPIGFSKTKREGDDEEAINRMFTPEFRNRLDAVISFASLPPDVISKVVDKFIFQLEAQLHDRNVTIELTEEANAWLAEKGYDEKFGARPLSRAIQEHIKRPLADELLFGRLKSGGTVRVIVKGRGKKKTLAFEYIETPAPKRRAGKGSPGKGTSRKGGPKSPKAGGGSSGKPNQGKPKSGKGKPKSGTAISKVRGSSPVPKVPLPAK
jgi:ATP-dependent Clp protease ATP-binding subunit ClpA